MRMKCVCLFVAYAHRGCSVLPTRKRGAENCENMGEKESGSQRKSTAATEQAAQPGKRQPALACMFCALALCAVAFCCACVLLCVCVQNVSIFLSRMCAVVVACLFFCSDCCCCSQSISSANRVRRGAKRGAKKQKRAQITARDEDGRRRQRHIRGFTEHQVVEGGDTRETHGGEGKSDKM